MEIADEYQIRCAKAKKLKEMGALPYRDYFNKTHFTSEVQKMDQKTFRDADEVLKDPNKAVGTAGRVITLRDHGKIIFADIQDMEGELQIALKSDVLGEKTMEFLQEFVDPGDFIGISGEPFITKQGKLALLAKEVELLSKTLRPLPSKHFGIEDIELKYRKRYLDLILDEKSKQTFKVRSAFVEALREWLLEHKFQELVTRTLQPMFGGAMAEPFVTKHNYLKQDFYLRISNELDLKMAVGAGIERAFEFSIDFRNEGLDASHLQEFQMLEWYCAYENYTKGIKWTQDMIRIATEKATGSTEFDFTDSDGKVRSIDLSGEIPVITFSDLMKKNGISADWDKEELIKYAKGKKMDIGDMESKGRGNLFDEIYKKQVRPQLIDPIFITKYPSDLFPLARISDDNNDIADAFQLVIAGWEIVKGYSELVDPEAQRLSFLQQQKSREEGDKEAMPVNNEFLLAMEHGFPPILGFGMGIDRIVALITGNKNLKDTVLFPLLASEK